jgi:hypothetical protein
MDVRHRLKFKQGSEKMLKILTRLVKLTVVTGIAIILLVFSFDNPANATVYNGGGVNYNNLTSQVSQLDLTPGGFTQKQCNVNSTGTLTLNAPPAGVEIYPNNATLIYQATGGLRCSLTVTSMVGSSKYRVRT